jgi:hypothetical protein
MSQRALIIGINYAHSSCELYGCLNDAHAYASLLTGFTSVRLLTEEEASRANILRCLEELVAATWTEPTRTLFLAYSGHGSQVLDVEGDELDHLDEVMISADYATHGVITDDLLASILTKANPETKVVCVFDACHSATLIDANRFVDNDDGSYAFTCPAAPLTPHPKPLIITLSGCRDDQTSADSWDASTGQAGGALSMALQHLMRMHNAQGCMPLGILDLHARINATLKQGGYEQVCVLTSSRRLTQEDTFM